tara:strand:+ start:1928 stop:3286 length:1359 start_codon:yes stop_codon:yes gene_type:complete
VAKLSFLIFFNLIVFSSITITHSFSYAQNLNLIRDSEIENTIRGYSSPLLKAAGLPDSSVRIHIVNDNNINAFVTNGLNIFINTGLIINSDSIGEITGVIAHEIGHLEGAHLARSKEAIRNAENEIILAQILGALTAIGSQNSKSTGNAASAIILAGSATAQNRFLRYNRSQEQAADQAALKYLDNTKQSANGLLAILKKLQKQEAINSISQNPISRTHPVTQERIRLVSKHIETSINSNNQHSPSEILKYERMKYKLKSFLSPPGEVIKFIDIKKNDLLNRYAKAILTFRTSDTELSLSILNDLIFDYPDDPWIHELLGQFLFESGLITQAITPYRQAVSIKPKEPLLRLGLARAQIESGKKENLSEAIKNLKIATHLENSYAPYWYFLAIAFGKSGYFAEAELALAESALLRGQIQKALHHAQKSLENIETDLPVKRRAQDIINLLENNN